jgi:HlyD family secretion protein
VVSNRLTLIEGNDRVKILTRIVIIVGILAAVGWGAGKWWSARAQSTTDDTTVVRVEPAAQGNLVEFISASGTVEPKTRVSISARVSARIIELPFKEGQRVTKGDPNAKPPIPPSVLVQLDSKDLEAQLKSVEARHAAEKASLEVSRTGVVAQQARIDSLKVMLADAKRELERERPLLETKDISQSTLDTLQTKVDQQQADLAAAVASLKGEQEGLVVLQHNIEAAEADIAKARDNLTYATITSPIDGVVTRLNAEVGELVVTGTMNNAGTMIMEVADLSQMVLRARVDEGSIADVKVGQKARIRMEAYRGKIFDGTVQSVALANYDPSLARGTGGNSRNSNTDSGISYEVEILIDTQGLRIFSGLSADADIETHRYQDIIKVPSQAVLGRSPDSLTSESRSKPEVDTSKATVPVVYRFLNGEAVETPVSIGASDLTHTVIKSGLKNGDVIIVGPYKALESLAQGKKVKADKASSTQPATSPSSPTTQSIAATQSSKPTGS